MACVHQYEAKKQKDRLCDALPASLRDRVAAFVIEDENRSWEVVLQVRDQVTPIDLDHLKAAEVATSVEFRLVQNKGVFYEFPDRTLSRRCRARGLSR